MWDHPSSDQSSTYSFETEVTATGGDQENTRTWGAVRWSFRTVKTEGDYEGEETWDIADEAHSFHAETSESHESAKTEFDKVMGNSGVLSYANINAAKDAYSDEATRDAGTAQIQAIKDWQAGGFKN